MSAGATPVPAHGRAAESERGSIVARLVAFAALSALVAWRWLSVISRPPAGRGIAALAAAVAGAAVLAALGRRGRLARPRIVVAAVTLTTVIAGLVAIGLEPRLLVPSQWGTLGRDLGDGLSGAFAASYPYHGADPWTRTVILLGLPLLLGIAAGLAFAPARGERLRTLGLATLFAAWAIASALNAPSAPVVWGVALFAAVAAWLWLGRMRRAIAAPAAALLGVAAAAAIPLALALDRGHPLLDYRHWNLDFSSPADRSISYSWNHTYGPLRWPRSGRTLFTVTGARQQYLRATTLDWFNGVRWVASTTAPARFQLPAPADRVLPTNPVAALDQRWVHRARFHLDALSSDLVVAPGTVLRLNGANLAGPSPTVPSSDVLGHGDSYSVVAYEPDPTPTELRSAPARLSTGLRRYTRIELPPIAANEVPADSLQPRAKRARTPLVRTVELPLYGRSGGGEARRWLARSAYGDVYALARRLTADSKTEYGAVEAIEGYLRSHDAYSESPPRRALPLRAFLFRDRIGYCQQFSGAMALMLRSIGVPTRVATGFSSGVRRASGRGYEIRDFDAHSWVEVYFNGIGWVPFDPTPSAAPTGPRLLLADPAGGLRGDLGGRLGHIFTGNRGRSAPGGGGAGPWPWIGVGLALLAATVASAAVRRRSRFLALPADAAGRAQARELGALAARLHLERDRAITLLELERRLPRFAGPAAAVYVGALRAARFGRDGASPPILRDRRRLRWGLYARSGLLGRIATLVAIPPGGPRS